MKDIFFKAIHQGIIACKVLVNKIKWRKCNKHNNTYVGKYLFPINKCSVGNMTYGVLNVHYYKTKNEELNIGNYCSIADDVHFFTGGGHDYKNIMSFPFLNYINENRFFEATNKGKIIVKDDVWIGYGVVILSGVTIGKGAVIGAKSIVTKDIHDYAIYAGGKIIGYRFSERVINRLKNIDYSKLDIKYIEKNIKNFYQHVSEKNIDDIIDVINRGQSKNE